VAAISSDDAWAAGYYNNTPDQTLIEHWDGKKWIISSTPNITGVLQAVGQVPGTDQLWAVGEYSNGNGAQGLIEFYC
jgi:hypothetical protein